MGKGNALYILLSGPAAGLPGSPAYRAGQPGRRRLKSCAIAVYKLAGEIAALAPLSHAVNKLTLRQVQAKPALADLTDEENALPLTQFDTEDYQEGYRSFVEKRRPNFVGR